MKDFSGKSPFAFIQPPTYRQFLFAVSVLTIAVLIACLAAIRSKNQKVYLFISTAVSASLLLNVFLPHVPGAIFYWNYAPGLVSAVLLNLPLSILVLYKNKSMFPDRKEMRNYIIWGIAAGYTTFAASLGLAMLLA
jgi:hypothetical protein